ncbi:YncE family protein [Thalassotalea euphylliae]|uniref:YncE family protein n=2 Tax=Thalassotalea euphylliae TaxID=1655234 RepID=A0A3E0TMV2_9GAMM|nr:YncE family protein [Thalassotalea euphylliae]
MRYLTLTLTFLLTLATSLAAIAALSGTLVVVNKRGDNMSFIDLGSRQVVATRATGKGPHEVAVTKDGKWAVVTDYVGGNSLSVFDIVQAKKVRTIDLSQYPWPHGILFLADQKRVAVSAEGADAVVIANIFSGEITQALNTEQKGSHMVALTGRTDKVYTTNMQSNSVSELSIDEGKLLRQISMPETPEAIAISANGDELWVGSNKAGLVTVFNTATGEQLKQWRDYTFPYRILLSQDEKYAVIPDFRQNTLDIIENATKKRLKRIQFPEKTTPNGVIFAPDQRTLFMSAYDQNKVFVIDVPSGKVKFELPAGDGPDGIGYSPFTLGQ